MKSVACCLFSNQGIFIEGLRYVEHHCGLGRHFLYLEITFVRSLKISVTFGPCLLISYFIIGIGRKYCLIHQRFIMCTLYVLIRKNYYVLC